MIHAVFDMDGVLANPEHRLHYIQGKNRDYVAFYHTCLLDETYPGALSLFRALLRGHIVEIWTGRDEECRPQTEAWLKERGVDPEELMIRMRPHGDHRPAAELKRGWLLKEMGDGGSVPELAIDDDPNVCQMYLEHGVNVWQPWTRAEGA